MARTFNCGIGMIAVIAESEAPALVAKLAEHGEFATVIGALTPRDGDAVTFSGQLDL